MPKLYAFDAIAVKGGVWSKILKCFGSIRNPYHQLLWQRKTYPNIEFLWSVFSNNQAEYKVNCCIRSEYGKIRIRKHSIFRQFSCSWKWTNTFKGFIVHSWDTRTCHWIRCGASIHFWFVTRCMSLVARYSSKNYSLLVLCRKIFLLFVA